jgi:uncharacterized membrane protein YfcA
MLHNLLMSSGKGTVSGPLNICLHDTNRSCSAMGTVDAHFLVLLHLFFLIARLAYPTLCTCATGSLLCSPIASKVINKTPLKYFRRIKSVSLLHTTIKMAAVNVYGRT